MRTKHVTIIAEAGVNHNGSIKTAKKLIDVAAFAGADFVKFQTFKAKKLVSENTEKAEYQKNNTNNNESQFDMIKRLELSEKDHEEIIDYCDKVNIRFLSTGFDIESIDLLSKYNMLLIKIPSGEITNLPYLRHIGSMNKPIVMSTGMSTLLEVSCALDVLLDSGAKRENITILHCNTEYPTPKRDVNLNAMITIRDKFGINIGYSDHTLGIEVPIAAAAMGATIIEKHFTLDRNLPGPDHSASLEPNELKIMVNAIRNIEEALGSKIKKPSESEKKNISIARKSIVAKKRIKIGEKFTKYNICAKRPGIGISPMEWDNVLKLKSKYNFEVDELIKIL